MKLEIITLFFEICLFRKAPEDIPCALKALQLSVLLYAGVGFIAIFMAADFLGAILQLATEILLILIFSWVLLRFFEKSARYIQTTTAFFGVDAVITFCAFPLLSSMITPDRTGTATVLLLIMMFWHLLVTGYVISHALSRSFWFGLLLAFCYIAVSFRIISLLFPPLEVIA